MSVVLSDEELKLFRDTFFLFDEDKSGCITTDEIESAFKKMDITVQGRDVKELSQSNLIIVASLTLSIW